MNYDTRMIELRIVFHGLYEWGRGWVSVETKNKWEDCLAQIEDDESIYFWNYFYNNKGCESHHLIGTQGNVFLHPMDIHTYIPLMGSSYRTNMKGEKVEDFPAIRELLVVLKNLAEYCGGTMDVDFVRLQEFNNNGNCVTTELKVNEILQEG